MKKTCISQGWYLHSPGYRGPVDLPNDYSVTLPRSPHVPGGASNGFFPNGTGYYQKDLALNAERGKERQARGVGILSGGPQGATLGPLPRPPEPCHPGLLTKRMKAASARKSPFL